jgi:antitoxin MazE
MTPVQPAYERDELLTEITPENRHDETDWGNLIGEEIW